MSQGTCAPSVTVPWQRVFVVGLLLLFVGLSVQYTHKALGGGSAFLRWRTQIQQLDAGEDIYERFVYPNPPIMALLLKPLVDLPPLVGSLSWFYLKVAMTLAALYWLFRLVELPEQPFPPWARAVTVLLGLRPIMGDLSHGNVNLLILFLVMAALFAFSRKQDVLAGVVLALAIACKVTPALFVPYFVWKRAWKTLAGCALGLFLFIWLVPGGILGFAQNEQLLLSWTERMIKPFVVDGVVTTDHNNQSLSGFLFRMLTYSPSFATYVHDQYTPVLYHNIAALEPRTVRWLIKGSMGLFALLVVWCCRTPPTPRRGWRLAAEYSLIVLGMLLFSERTWKHHCVTLLLPFAVISYYLATCQPERSMRSYLVATLVGAAVLMASTSTSLLDAADAKLAQTYGAYIWAYLLLAAALVVLLRQPESHPNFGVRWLDTGLEGGNRVPSKMVSSQRTPE